LKEEGFPNGVRTSERWRKERGDIDRMGINE
jgi:hypothetical protein